MVIEMVNEDKGRIFKRKDGKYLLYLPLNLCEDSMFPFKDFEVGPRGVAGIDVKVSFKIGDKKKQLLIEEWKPEAE